LIGWQVTFSRQTASMARLFSRSRPEAVRDELRKRGFLDQNEKGHLTPTSRADFRPARLGRIAHRVIVESASHPVVKLCVAMLSPPRAVRLDWHEKAEL
jgi:hypothetical protein